MILILNGSFGVGKTTVAKRLATTNAGALIYDPERWGYVLQRLPPWMLGRTKPLDDFQDLPLWRCLVARGIGRASRKAKLVIVPMAFSDAGRLDDLRTALRTRSDVQTICLVAPLDIVTGRLAQRAKIEGRPVSQFEVRRSAECVAAHANNIFGTPIDATASAESIAAMISALMAG